jgi:hypothetical protein
MEQVLCKNCKWFLPDAYSPRCSHPENRDEVWGASLDVYRFRRRECKGAYFEPKEPKISWRRFFS